MSHILKRDQRKGGRGRFHGRQRWRMRPTFLELEGRALLSTIVVNSPTDTPVVGETDLRQAIALANTNGGAESITFDKTVFRTPQTINLDPALGQLELSDQTGTETITGPRAGVTIHGNYTTSGIANSVFEIEPGATATLSGLTITGGNNAIYGGGVDDQGTATLIDCTVSGNAGGGIVNNFGSATLTDCTISNNSAGFYGFGGGGGVWSYGTTKLTNCTISGNSAPTGGGLANYGGTTTLTNCNVSGNSAQYGGGVRNDDGLGAEYATTKLANCIVSGNSAQWGGGLQNINGAITLANCAVDNNHAVGTFDFDTAEGGGILSTGGSLSISGSTLAGNTATGVLGVLGDAGYGIGGGIALGDNGTATVTNTAFLGNLAQGAAGASGVIGGEATGGAIAVGLFNTGVDGLSNASLAMSGCLLIGNVAQAGAGGSGADGGNASGGGIFVAVDASATVNQTVVSMNLALGGLAGAGGSDGDGDGVGGGLYISTGGVVTLKKTTVALNFASTSNDNIYGTVS
jgi:hypothetical protein